MGGGILQEVKGFGLVLQSDKSEENVETSWSKQGGGGISNRNRSRSEPRGGRGGVERGLSILAKGILNNKTNLME